MVKIIDKKNILKVFVFLGLIMPAYMLFAGQDQYKAASRYDYYTLEEEVEILVWVPQSRSGIDVSVDIMIGSEYLIRGGAATPGQLNKYALQRDVFMLSANTLSLVYFEEGKAVGSGNVEVLFREHKYNAVKIDRFSGGLIVEGMPFYPFGFYTYSPVQEGLPAEEAVKGFNMMSPYQKIEGKTINERKAWMDRCAALGMKVNYNLLGVAGGGGPGSERQDGLSHKKRMKLLRKEIETFRDHPALLSWYISDEPAGQGLPPDSLAAACSLIKELDPYHPVSMVFMLPEMAKHYSRIMDIVMADPYPVPNASIKEVGNTAAKLYEDFFLEKPVWIVPQAFGGNEWWLREPTHMEMRAMTYLALVNRAMGIQYFIRHGPNAFPKSTVAWNECGAMALEFAEITPYLFSDEPDVQLASDNENIQLRSFHKDGAILVVAVNTVNEPLPFSFTMNGLPYRGSAKLLFEDRRVTVFDGRVEDIIDAFGTRIYEIRYKTSAKKGARVHPQNMIVDGSFEDITGIGIPASCYAIPGGDKGATCFIDSRSAARGLHSLRMTTPTRNEGMALSFYNQRIEAGQSYTFSIYARALPYKFRGTPERGIFKKLCGCGPDAEEYPEFKLSAGESCEAYFKTTQYWTEYGFSCLPTLKEGKYSISPVLELTGEGTAWFDLLQMVPDMDIKSRVSRESNNIDIHLTTVHQGAIIYYTTEGSIPGTGDQKYAGLFSIDEPAIIKAIAYRDGEKLGYIERYFEVHYATGRFVDYKFKYSPKYDAGLNDGLVDGILASPDHKDGKWQGFEGDDLDVVVNLKTVRSVKEIRLRFLRNRSSWIFLPQEIKISWSADGNEYYELKPGSIIENTPAGSGIHQYTYAVDEGLPARYIRIYAKNTGTCPEGHPGAGEKAWLFTDEIIIK
ncbi:MAG: chitobiase/beta-hexosaminidase C-terminal domain-containing protein [Bacteroidales bacterium]|nr:chitobiase/beta-hexosaminidase C-terminal domain-containing protein [Bacteroidales bacterium]